MRTSQLNIHFFEASIQVFCPFWKLSSFWFAGILPKSCIRILYPTYLNVFSQTSACLLTFLMPFDKQHFLILMKFNWSIFPIAVNVYLCHLKKIFPTMKTFSCFLLEVLAFMSPFFPPLLLISSPNPAKFVIFKFVPLDNTNWTHYLFCYVCYYLKKQINPC